jgi:hypothetical protein
MRAFLMAAGTVFSLVVLAHVLRYIQEGPRVLTPWWIAATIVAAGLSVWAWILAARPRT